MAILSPPVEPDQFSGRGTRIPDVPMLLAVLSARQRILPTASAMRAGGMDVGDAPADRMVRVFVTGGTDGGGAKGAFHREIARMLSGTQQGEGDVYRGA